jgi:hypothetical protein
LAADKVRVVDASESSIESREAALLALRDVGQPKAPLEGVLIYVPRQAALRPTSRSKPTRSRSTRSAAPCSLKTMVTST